ncbi:major facilitator superfamily domain-containing protein [Fusarium sp. MPI-SDFR-AT-0072]|nr:major facilitator superfamily domain-containing protein [Fusarium sp. MPI-SDFR-AT-0072]
MSEKRDKTTDELPNAVEVELLTVNEVENYQGLTLKCVLVYLSILLACFAQILAVVATGAFPRNMANVLGGHDKYIWVPQGLVICVTFTAAPIAQSSDFWGRRIPILICTALCIVGSTLISRASSMTMAIAGSLIVGVGSGSSSLLYAVASEIMPRQYRPVAQAGVNISNSLGGLFTLLLGFGLVKKDDEGFRTVWYVGTGLFALNFLAIFFLFNPPKRRLEVSLTWKEKFNALDWIGYILFSIGMIMFSVGLTWANNPYSWKSTQVLSTFIIGLVFIVFTVIWEIKKKDGFCHHGLFQTSRNFPLALVFIFVEGFAFYAANNFLPLVYSVYFNSDLFKVGVLMSLIFIAGTVASIVGGIYSTKSKRVRPPLTLGMILFVAYFACMATLKPSQSDAIWGYTVLAGLGLGFGLVIAVTTGQISTPPGLIATTSGLILTSRSLGGSVALPVYTAILNSLLTEHLGKKIAEGVLPLGLSAKELPAFISAFVNNDQKAMASIPGITPEIISAGVVGLRSAYRIAFRGTWSAAAAVSAVGLILSLFVKDPRNSFNMHVDAPVEHELAQTLHTKETIEAIRAENKDNGDLDKISPHRV